jgi:hypothetical protein
MDPLRRHRVLLAFFVTPIVEVVAMLDGRRLIDLRDTRLHLLDESLFKISVLTEDGIGVRIFLFEISNDLRILALPKPVVLVVGGLFRSGRRFRFVGTACHNQRKKSNNHRHFCKVHCRFLTDLLSMLVLQSCFAPGAGEIAKLIGCVTSLNGLVGLVHGPARIPRVVAQRDVDHILPHLDRQVLFDAKYEYGNHLCSSSI